MPATGMYGVSSTSSSRRRPPPSQKGLATGADEEPAPRDPGRQIRWLRDQQTGLQKENTALRSQKQEIESLYQQLMSETRRERFDERRLNLLKAQNMQLERQLALTLSALQSRRDVVTQAHEVISEVSKGLSATELPRLERRAGLLLKKVESLHAGVANPSLLQQKLYHVAEAQSSRDDAVVLGEHCARRPSFVCEDAKEVAVSDVLSVALADGGGAPHIDLDALAQLEQRLADLTPLLAKARTAIATVALPCMLDPSQERLTHQVHECAAAIHAAAYDLGTLRLLLPSARSAARPRGSDELEQRDLMGFGDLPELPTGKAVLASYAVPLDTVQRTEFVRAVDAVLQQATVREEWLLKQADASTDELRFYGSTFKLQTEYINNLCRDVEERYLTVDDGALMQDVINSFDNFETNTSEATLRTFLKVFKHHQPALQQICDRLARRPVWLSMAAEIETLRKDLQVKFSDKVTAVIDS